MQKAEQLTSGSRSRLVRGLAIAAALVLTVPAAFAQDSQSRAAQGKEGNAPAPTIDAATGKALNEAIELMNMEKYAEAQAKIGTLNLEKLSPYERSKVEQILFNISYAQEKYEEARGHLQKSIDAGGLNEQEISQARYQFAQLYMTEEKWKEGAAALEEWFKTAAMPNSAAYYLLAVAYYQLEDYGRSLPNAQKAIELSDKPQESWLQLLLALYLQKEQFKDAIPLLVRLVEGAPEVEALFERRPFADHPPRFVRAELYEYRMASRATTRRTGERWVRRRLGPYVPCFPPKRPPHRPTTVAP